MPPQKDWSQLIFPLPRQITQLIQTQAFLLLSPNRNPANSQQNTILKCFSYQSLQQAKQNQLKFLSLSSIFHLTIYKHLIEQNKQQQYFTLVLQIQAPSMSLKEKFGLFKESQSRFTEDHLVLIINCMNLLFFRNFILSEQKENNLKTSKNITASQLLDNIFLTKDKKIKLAVPQLLYPVKKNSSSYTFKKNNSVLKDFGLFLIQIILFLDKRDLMDHRLIHQKLNVINFDSFALKQMKTYILQRIVQYSTSLKISTPTFQTIYLSQGQLESQKKFPSIRSLKSSKVKKTTQKAQQTPHKSKSFQSPENIKSLKQKPSILKSVKHYKTLNQVAQDRIVQSFQQDEYSYILQSNNTTPGRTSPHKLFPVLQHFPSPFLQSGHNVLDSQSNSTVTQIQPTYNEQTMENDRETLVFVQNTSRMTESNRTQGLVNSNVNSIILEVEEQSNYEYVEESFDENDQVNENQKNDKIVEKHSERSKDSKSDIMDLSCSQNAEDLIQIRQIYDPQSQTTYMGQILNGQKHGKGKIVYPDGGYYEGQWKEDQIFGFGRLFYPSTKLAYAGYWKHNCFHGPGLVLNQEVQTIEIFDFTDFSNLGRTWISYRGNFNMDIREGFGIVKLSNGDSIEGNWEFNCLHGQADYKRHDGSVIKGFWKNNRLEKIISQQSFH